VPARGIGVVEVADGIGGGGLAACPRGTGLKVWPAWIVDLGFA
jgi:hypothetical protein